LQKLVEEGEETKDKEEFELGAERTVKELTSTSQVWCCKEAQGDESGERPEEAKSFVVSSPPHTALSRRRGARTRLQKMVPAGFEWDVEEAKHAPVSRRSCKRTLAKQRRKGEGKENGKGSTWCGG